MSKIPSFTKPDRVAAIAKQTGLDPKDVQRVLDADDEVIGEALRDGKRVYLDNLCTVVVQTKPATRKYIPSVGDYRDIPERRVPKFTPSKTLTERV
jgi:nucleoid DNA-binding protein